jgi:OOP family OmpA-OmpF porin
MIKKVLCIFPLISFLYGTTPESEIGINVGMASTKNKHGSNFENPTFGLSYQDSRYVVSPRIDVEYVNLKREEARALMKVSLNGVYEYENRTPISPYILGGIGYEKVDGEQKDVIESHTFVQAGVGVRMDIEDGYTAKIEGRFLQILSGNDEENEAVVTAGLSIPIASSTARPKPIIRKRPQRRVAIIKPIQVVKPIIIHEPPKIFNSNNNECSIKISLPDFDRDGIEDRLDQCPDTPCNFSVDGYGCPIKATLKIHFSTNSSDIRGYSMVKVDEFAHFLLKNRGSMITIIGHTDSFGSSILNRKLSYARAKSVVLALIDKGVSPSRIHALGRGESEPVASNKSEEGRAKNRRIEAVLTYLKRK